MTGYIGLLVVAFLIGRRFSKNRLKNIENKTRYELDTYFDSKKGILYINKVKKVKAEEKPSTDSKDCLHPAKHIIPEYIDKKYQHFCELCGEVVKIK